MTFLLFALAMSAMPAAVASLATVSAGSPTRTSAGRTSAATATPAFTASGTSGGVVRSNVHVILFFVLLPALG